MAGKKISQLDVLDTLSGDEKLVVAKEGDNYGGHRGDSPQPNPSGRRPTELRDRVRHHGVFTSVH